MQPGFSSPDDRKRFALMGIAWLLLQVFLLFRTGIVTDFEALKYIVEADNLLSEGRYSSGNFLFYSTQILLIAFSKITGTFPWLPVVIQIAVNAVSVICLYKIVKKISGLAFTATIAVLVFLAMYYYQLYNVYLFTESLFYSFGIIYTWLLFSIKKPSFKNILLVIAAMLVIYFTRPMGIFFLPATILYFIFRFYRKKAVLLVLLSFAAGLAALVLLLNFALGSGGEFDFLLPYLDERIICGVPTIEKAHNISVPVEKNSVQGLWYIITHHTDLFLKLAAKRFVAFWGMTRSFYDPVHNIFLIIYFYTLYMMIILNMKRLFRENTAETIFFLTLTAFTMITVMLSCDEWHNRFILALLPFFIIMASKTGLKLNQDARK